MKRRNKPQVHLIQIAGTVSSTDTNGELTHAALVDHFSPIFSGRQILKLEFSLIAVFSSIRTSVRQHSAVGHVIER